MPRSSRHKSSKHSSRDAREYSDSEKESSMKERKAKEEGGSRVSKDSASNEKRKLVSKEAKDLYGSGNGEYSESKRRKEREKEKEKDKEKIEESVSDRWNGGADHRGEGTRKTKEVKSKRREDGEGEETKKGSAKSEGKHRESSRKEGREGGVEKERERKGKEGKIEKLVVDNGVERTEKKPSENTELNPQDNLQNHEPENQLERRIRKRRNGFGDEDKRQDDIGDINDRRLSSNDDTAIVKDGRLKDEKHNDERYRDKYREDVDKDKHRDDKQRDDRLTRDYTSSKSDDKHLRDGKDTIEIRLKKSKPLDGDRDHDREHDPGRNRERDRHRDHECDRGRDRDRYRDRDRDRDREREHDRERDRYRDHDSERDRNRYRDWDWDRERDRDQERDWFRDRGREHDLDLDGDGPTVEERSARYKDGRGKKRSPDDRDDHNDINTRGMKACLLDMEKKSLSSNRVESDANRGTTMNNRRRSSPNCISHVGLDEYRHVKQEDLKYRDYATEQRPKSISSREVTGFSGVTERLSKYRSMDRPVKMDDGHMGELSAERSSSSKASPMDVVERSPSLTSVEHKYTNRSGGRQSLDIEETGRRSSGSIGVRDFSSTDDRLSQDLPVEKLLLDESSQADSSFYNRTSQGNSSSFIPLPPTFRAGLDSPFLGSLENDSRVNYNARHKRNGDPNVGRGPGNTWRGVPNWPSPVPNGFISYQHGPPHGGFPAMMPQFPPPLFGVRPSMEMNHSGIPYHIPDADRFSSHLRPLGWQNMMDGSGPSHLHGWDGNNGVLRDEPHMYVNPDWDQNRLPMNGRGWQTSVDMWKGQNGDVNMDLASQKEDSRGQVPVDDVLAGLAGQRSQQENKHHEVQAKSIETRPSVTSQEKTSKSPPKATHERASEPSMIATSDGVSRFFNIYLSKLDISAELANLELYNKCMISLDVEHGATAEDTSMHVILKNGARAGLKTSNALRSCPLFPAINDSVFQKAMNLYKQSIETRGMPIIRGRMFDMILASNQDTEAACKKEKAKGSVPTSDPEMSNVAVIIVDQKRGEAIIAAAEENLEGQVSTPQDIQAIVHVPPGPPPTMVPVQALSRENSEEKSDGMIAEQVNLQDGDGNIFSSLNNSSHAATILPTDGGKANGFNTAKSSDSTCFAGTRQAVDDSFNGPLVFSDGSPKASETLMPGSNESESVIFSRIHHSPESTH